MKDEYRVAVLGALQLLAPYPVRVQRRFLQQARQLATKLANEADGTLAELPRGKHMRQGRFK